MLSRGGIILCPGKCSRRCSIRYLFCADAIRAALGCNDRNVNLATSLILGRGLRASKSYDFDSKLYLHEGGAGDGGPWSSIEVISLKRYLLKRSTDTNSGRRPQLDQRFSVNNAIEREGSCGYPQVSMFVSFAGPLSSALTKISKYLHQGNPHIVPAYILLRYEGTSEFPRIPAKAVRKLRSLRS